MADYVDPVPNIIEKVAQDVVNEDRRDKIRQGINLADYEPQLRTLLLDQDLAGVEKGLEVWWTEEYS